MNAPFGYFQETFLILSTLVKIKVVVLQNAIQALQMAKKELVKPHVLDEIEVRDSRTSLDSRGPREHDSRIRYLIYVDPELSHCNGLFLSIEA